MSYRPICDVWILARPKVKYYGAYPNGFLERAKVLLGGGQTLHVCGGHAKAYPNRRLVALDATLDLDRSTHPDYLHDARESFAEHVGSWPSVLIDPPYTEADAAHYLPELLTRERAMMMPRPNQLLRHALQVVPVGGRVGMLHYVLPQPPKTDVKFIACVGVIVGFNNRMRVFSVFERTHPVNGTPLSDRPKRGVLA